MLVLTRRIGEEIMIAGNIRVRVLSIQGRKARIGILAPPSVPVNRLELLAEQPDPPVQGKKHPALHRLRRGNRTR